jgi:hypothetical protein
MIAYRAGIAGGPFLPRVVDLAECPLPFAISYLIESVDHERPHLGVVN